MATAQNSLLVRHDPESDCLEIKCENSPTTEKKITKRFSLLRREPDDAGLSHIGFVIYGAMEFCEEQSLIPPNGPVNVARILERIGSLEKEAIPAIQEIVPLIVGGLPVEIHLALI